MSQRATLPPEEQTATNNTPHELSLPPGLKWPAQIEFPPTSIYAGFFLPSCLIENRI